MSRACVGLVLSPAERVSWRAWRREQLFGDVRVGLVVFHVRVCRFVLGPGVEWSVRGWVGLGGRVRSGLGASAVSHHSRGT